MSTRVLARREPGAGFACAATVGCRATFAEMDSPDASSSSPPAGDDYPRVKFLCSFGGSILPRPLDGRLRYVGGETRIVPVPRDISYEDFLARMRELFEGASIIKYQQPDEDLDALVSVVNDDDMMNMMEEYDKLGTTGEGFTRLRIFLFSQPPEADLGSVTLHDERETERRYVDALNSLPDTRSPPSLDVPESFFTPITIDGGIQGQVNLHHLAIPHSSHGQRYNEMDSPWNPAYFSPRHALDSREFPPSPSSVRFHVVSGEFGDRMQDEYARQTAGHHLHPYEHQSLAQPIESFVWLPPGSAIQEKSGFPNNLGHSHPVMEGNNICEHCHRMTFHRNQGAFCDTRYLDPRWKHGQTHLDQPNAMNEYGSHFPHSCVECYANQDSKLEHGVHSKEHNEQHRPLYNEIHGHERGWLMHNNQLNNRFDDPRFNYSGIGRVSEQYAVDNNMMNIPLAQNNMHDGHSLPSNFIGHDDKRYFQHSTEAGNEVFHVQQNIGGGPYTNIACHEDSTIRYGNQPSAYVADNLYQVPHNLPQIPSLRRNAQVPSLPGTSYELSGFMRPNDAPSSGFERFSHEESPRLSYAKVDDQTPNDLSALNTIIAPKMVDFEGSAAPDLMHDHDTELGPNIHNQETLLPFKLDSVPFYENSNMEPPPQAIAMAFSSSSSIDKELNISHVSKQTEISKEHPGDLSENGHVKVDFEALKLNDAENAINSVHIDKINLTNVDEVIPGENLNFLPELIASVTEAVLKGAEEVITKDQEDSQTGLPACQEDPIHESAAENANQGAEADTDGDGEHEQPSKIEPTTAEAEALDKGLQTIRNDDLEEIRELGSGTYGSVFYGKWKGSDVAIKRIKASCFAGKPSERERLIADFWKEALIMSSLHHPNVVSFYGVVRDGPDGSLATVTEFMVNGSLKQFLQKKDRTIDRRKRLIIAMDAAFGMEYLHSKNIVHFDLKCENLLVNMRDPQRPICKIGDLGLSKVKQHTLVSGGIRGTLPWMAPELLSGKSNMVSEKIDVYSFGIVMWELLTGEEPYADMRGASIIGGIVSNTLRPKIPTWCDPEWKALMESCWSCDPTLRPSFSEVSQKLRKMAAAINLK